MVKLSKLVYVAVLVLSACTTTKPLDHPFDDQEKNGLSKNVNRELSVGEFHSVNSHGPFDLVLYPSTHANKIKVSGDSVALHNAHMAVHDGVLILRVDGAPFLKQRGARLHVDMPVVPEHPFVADLTGMTHLYGGGATLDYVAVKTGGCAQAFIDPRIKLVASARGASSIYYYNIPQHLQRYAWDDGAVLQLERPI